MNWKQDLKTMHKRQDECSGMVSYIKTVITMITTFDKVSYIRRIECFHPFLKSE